MTMLVPMIEGFLNSLETAQRLTFAAVVRAHSAYAATGHPIDIVVHELGLIPELKLAEALAHCCHCDSSSEISAFDEERLDRIGLTFAQENAILPGQWRASGELLRCPSIALKTFMLRIPWLTGIPTILSGVGDEH